MRIKRVCLLFSIVFLFSILFGCTSEADNELLVLQQQHNDLLSDFQGLQNEYADLNQLNLQLQAENEELAKGRSLKDIPTSPSISGISVLGINGGLILKLRNTTVLDVTDTRSMHPAIGAGHSIVITKRFSPLALQVGNIIVYRASFTNLSVVHRIIEVRPTPEGVCYVLQGDNVAYPDPGCVTPSQIDWLVAGVIFNRVAQDFVVCPDNTYGILKDTEFKCIPRLIQAGIYSFDQPIESARPSYNFCSQSGPSRPYTVVTPQGTVTCYATVS